MEKHHKFSIWYVLLGFWVVLLFQHILVTAMAIKTIPYSEFLRLLKENKIAEVAIGPNQIQGRIRPQDSSSKRGILFRTVRVDPEISKELAAHNVTFKGELESTFLRDLMSWIVPVFVFVSIWYFAMRRIQNQQPGFMTLGKNKARIYQEDELGITFDDVAGVDEAKQELMEVVDFLKTPAKYSAIGGRIPKGILLVGPPGTGKTLLAKAVAGESRVPFFSMSGSEFVEMFVGMGAARVRDLFTQAKQKAPCIIFIDELDALGKARGIGPVAGHDEREQTLNQLLVEMDGFDPSTGVILMAATNRPEILDPALLRPGRFDRQVLVDKPDKAGREAILKVHLREIKTGPDVDPEAIAAMTSGMSGADLANLVNEAALLAVRNSKTEVGMAEIQEAVERVIAGLEKKNRLINPEEKKIVAYHEIGHAIVAMSLPGTDPVQKITIVPRGVAALGYTMQVPTEDRFLMKRSELLNRIATLLGGRAAETIVFEDISTGAHNDLSRATDIARSMVVQYGMSTKVGQVYFGSKHNAPLLGVSDDTGKPYSPATAELIDKEIQQILEKQYQRAIEILNSKRTVLEKAAVILLEKETIEGRELEKLLQADSGD